IEGERYGKSEPLGTWQGILFLARAGGKLRSGVGHPEPVAGGRAGAPGCHAPQRQGRSFYRLLTACRIVWQWLAAPTALADMGGDLSIRAADRVRAIFHAVAAVRDA